MNIETRNPTIPTRPNWRGRALLRLMEERGLHAVYQPILDQRQGRYFAFEALIRGPENSELHTPAALFATADALNCTHELEWLAVETAILQFAEQNCATTAFRKYEHRLSARQPQTVGGSAPGSAAPRCTTLANCYRTDRE